MAKTKADIELLFGVKGGGDVKGESGDLIKRQLDGIIGAINAKPLEIKFKADESSLKSIRDQIQKIMGSINVNVGATGGTKSGGSSSSGSKSSGSTGAMSGKALESALQKIETLQHKLETSKIKLDSIIDADGADAVARKIQAISDSLEGFKSTTSNGMTKVKFDESIAKYAREVSGAKNEVDEFSQKTKIAAKEQKELEAELKKSASGAEQVKLEFKEASVASTGFTSKFSQLSKELLGFYSLHTVAIKVVSTIKDMINNAVELETAFSDTRIVTHATEQEMKQLGVTITDVANETAASIESLVSATTAYARLGYSLDESTILAKYTGMLEKVGNVDTQKAEDAITSIVKAFPNDVDVKNIEKTMDMLIKTGNNFPISVAQIASGMTNASSALAAAGNDFKQSVALLTAANTTVQNAEKASTALRTMAARIRKTDADIDGEDVITEAKHEELINALTKHHVKLTELNGEYKSTYQIMQEIAQQWDTMTSMEQSAVAELVAGTRQQVVFYSIINNFKEAEEAMRAMDDSAGTLQQSYNVYLETAAAHIEQFNIAWKTLSMDVVNSDALKRLIDIGTAILKVADALQRAHMLLPTIIASVTAFKGLKFATDLAKQKSSAEALVKTMLSLTDVEHSVVGVTKQTSSVFNEMSYAQQALVAQTLKRTSESIGSMEREAAQAVLTAMSEQGLADSTLMAAGATDTLNFSIKGLLASNPVGWIMLAISAVVGIGAAIYDVVQKNKEAEASIDDIKDKLEELSNNAQQTTINFRQVNESAADIIPVFTELAKGVDQYGQKTSKLTDEEYAEFVSLSNQLAELFPQIAYGMDDSGNAMLDLNYKSADLADTLWRIVDAQREMARLEIANQMDDAVSNAIKADKIYKEQEDEINNAISALKEFRNVFATSGSINEYTALGEFDLTTALDAIRKVSPEIDDIVDKLGKASDASGSLIYSLSGNGGQYLVYDQFIEEVDRVLDHTESRLASAQRKTESTVAWNTVKQTALSWIQGQREYVEASNTVQAVIEKMIGDVDLSGVSITSGNSLQNYLYDNIIDPISKMNFASQNAISSFEMSMSLFESGKIGVSGITDSITSLTDALTQSGLSAKETASIMNALGATELGEKISEVRASIRGEIDDVKALFDEMSFDDFDIAYDIISKEGSMTLDEFKQKLSEVKNAASDLASAISAPVGITEFMKDLQDSAAKKKIDAITEAMKTLKNGTALTTAELVKLGQQFPELLDEADLFSDGSIEGQRRMLEFILESNKKEYDSKIDTRVAQLNVEIESAKAQVELEKSKQKLMDSIQKKALDDKITQDTAYLKEVVALNELNAKSFASLEDGKVTVNTETLNAINKGTNSALADAVNNLWDPYGQAIVKIHEEAAWASLVAENSLIDGTAQALQALGNTVTLASYLDPNVPAAAKNEIQNAVDRMLASSGGGIDLGPYLNYGNTLNYQHTSYSGSVRELTKGYSGINEWYRAASESSTAQIEAWEKAITALEYERKNIEALKDAIDTSSLDDLVKETTKSAASSAASSSSSTGKSGAITEFETWYKARNHELNMINAGVDPYSLQYIEGNRYVAPSQQEYVFELARRIKNLLDQGEMSAEDSYKYLEEIQRITKQFTDDAQKAVDDIVDYRAKAIKEDLENEKKALNNKLSTLKDFYNKQKDLIKDARDEEKYLDEQEEKRSAVADLRAQLDMLKYDTSAWGRKRIKEVETKLAEAEKELSDFEKDRASEEAQKLLDDTYVAQEEEIKNSIESLEEQIANSNAIRDQALSDIKTNASNIYEEMKKSGEDIAKLVTTLDNAIKAYEEYMNLSSLYMTGTPYSGGFNGIGRPYASGTANATRGWHMINERGAEAIFSSANGSKYRLFSGGEMVLTSKASNFLYNFANKYSEINSANSLVRNIPQALFGKTVSAGVIQTGDIIINGSASESTVSEIRRAQRDQVTNLLKELGRLK